MKTGLPILFSSLILLFYYSASAQDKTQTLNFDFFGDEILVPISASFIPAEQPGLNDSSIDAFYNSLNHSDYKDLVGSLTRYRTLYSLDDWLYYQLVRKVAQAVSPKKENYIRYTLYKCFLMNKSGYDATVRVSNNKILFYVKCDENIYNVPYFKKDDQQFVCLNYHDYNNDVNFNDEIFSETKINEPCSRKFSYKINHLPAFHDEDYQVKDIKFSINENEYDFKVRVNSQVKSIFNNYPVVDYESYFNIPLSNETYNSLIPALKKTVKGLSVKNGVDYLMRFTRYAFMFGKDADVFGSEKRLSPEQTLLFDQSDCEDRAALFFYLVKEIYNLPMVVLSFPEHVTIAVKLDKPVGKRILYNGQVYSVCEPTPQKSDLRIGELLPTLQKEHFEIAYSYQPLKN